MKSNEFVRSTEIVEAREDEEKDQYGNTIYTPIDPTVVIGNKTYDVTELPDLPDNPRRDYILPDGTKVDIPTRSIIDRLQRRIRSVKVYNPTIVIGNKMYYVKELPEPPRYRRKEYELPDGTKVPDKETQDRIRIAQYMYRNGGYPGEHTAVARRNSHEYEVDGKRYRIEARTLDKILDIDANRYVPASYLTPEERAEAVAWWASQALVDGGREYKGSGNPTSDAMNKAKEKADYDELADAFGPKKKRTEYKGSGNPASAEIADLMHDTDADRFLRNLTGDSGQHFDSTEKKVGTNDSGRHFDSDKAWADENERIEKEIAQTDADIEELKKDYEATIARLANNQAQPKQEYIKSVRDLIALNPQIKNPNLIYPGQEINVGDGRTYTVQKGDNLTKISKMDHGPGVEPTVDIDSDIFFNPINKNFINQKSSLDTDTNIKKMPKFSGDNISANFAESSELDIIKKLSGIKR